MRRVVKQAGSRLQQYVRAARTGLLKGPRSATLAGSPVLRSAAFLLIASVSLLLAQLLFLVSRLWLVIGQTRALRHRAATQPGRPLTSDEFHALAFGVGVAVVAPGGYWLALPV